MGKEVNLRFLGGVGEVGRSSIYLSSGDTTVLLDYGVLLNHEPSFPLHVQPKNLDGILLTHAHLDHSGGIPLFYLRRGIPLYTTELTLRLSRVLINDLIKLSGYFLPYEDLNVNVMERCFIPASYGEKFRVKDLSFEFKDAGHIPGSAQIVVNVSEDNHGKTIVYTGDINLRETKLLNAAETPYGEISCLILESTYATEDHPPRCEVEEAFVRRVREIVEGGGTVLVPAFSVGRSQEVLCVLAEKKFDFPIVMDGMALEVNKILLEHPGYFRDYELLKHALNNVEWVERWKDRRLAVKKPCVIISPAGMLQGGAAAFYVKEVAKVSKNAIFLVSFQIAGTPGRRLLEEKKMFFGGWKINVEAEVEKFDFSSHAGESELKEFLKNIKGNPTVFLVHGSREKSEKLAEWIKVELGIPAYVPSIGDVFKV
ncbi:MAG: MBL fold metallo-hydrolase [Candidatus Bathyarchaeota archaeon]|nr:MBL fold metallo-hydrolase [Candidatus Bathyarchaeota archaeon]